MAFGATNINPDRSPVVISIEVSDKFYAELQQQIEEAAKSAQPDQILAILLVLLGFSLLTSKTPQETAQDESGFAWNYLSQLQKELPKGKALGDLLREANIQLVVNKIPIELPALSENSDNLIDPVESFKRGWAQAMRGEVLTEDEFWKAVTEDE